MNIKYFISTDEAMEIYKKEFPDMMPTESIPLNKGLGRVLAKDYFAKHSIPIYRASKMDGVAINSERFNNERDSLSKWKLGVDFERADTGDDFPDAYDAVIRIEDVEIGEDGIGLRVKTQDEIFSGYNVNSKGKQLKEGSKVGLKGSKLSPTELAALAMGNISEIEVYKKPTVAFIPTGSELVSLGSEVKRGQNIDSNSILAKALLDTFNCNSKLYNPVADDMEAISKNLLDAVDSSDVVIINGGSSKGNEDFGIKALNENGECFFHWVDSAPGRPAAFGKVKGKPVVIIPGPGFGCLNVFRWFIYPIVSYLTGSRPTFYTVEAELENDEISIKPVKFLMGVYVTEKEDGTYSARLVNPRESDFNTTFLANGFLTTLGNGKARKKGEKVRITLLKSEI